MVGLLVADRVLDPPTIFSRQARADPLPPTTSDDVGVEYDPVHRFVRRTPQGGATLITVCSAASIATRHDLPPITSFPGTAPRGPPRAVDAPRSSDAPLTTYRGADFPADPLPFPVFTRNVPVPPGVTRLVYSKIDFLATLNEFDKFLGRYHVQEANLDHGYCCERLDQWAEETARKIVDFLCVTSALAFRSRCIPKTLSIFADGWDSKKISFPSVFNKPKYIENIPTFPCRVIGVLVHGWYYFCHVDPHNRHGSNINIVAIMYALTRMRERFGGFLPPTLHLQLDNASENKCKYFFWFCAFLVLSGAFRKVKLGYASVGHTHTDGDGRATGPGQLARREGVECFEDAFRIIGTSKYHLESYWPSVS